LVDYLCLKLHKVTEDILDIPHFDCLRKFNTYRALDILDQNLPIAAYPIISNEGVAQVNRKVQDARDVLGELIGASTTAAPVPDIKEDPELMEALKAAMGGTMTNIEELMHRG